jgi:FKBP-type peptidyl-prolyl cis-trans isomerase 2
MESEPKPQKFRDPQRVFMALLIAGIVVSVGAIGYILYSGTGGSHIQSTPAIASGDSVNLNYIGTLADGRVFDTSLRDVANDDVSHPKSLTFSHRENTSYTVFTMTAGKYGTGGTIKGFALGVIGMHVNETKLIEVQPADGYAVDPTMVATKNLVEEIVGTETYSATDFVSLFSTEPILMRTITHFFWGWDAQIVYNSSARVTIKLTPTVGQVVYPFGSPDDPDVPSGWPVVVESYDPLANGGAGSIVIRHQLTSADVYNVKGFDVDGVEFVVSGLNSTNGTFQIHRVVTASGYNGELAGRTLFFEVTVVEITPAQS